MLSKRFAAVQKASRPKRQQKKKRVQVRRQRPRAAVAKAVPLAKSVYDPPTSRASSRIVRREVIAQIYGGTVPTVSYYMTNPRVAETFPWLSGIAWSYDMFRFNSLRFCYEPSCPTTLSGQVAMFFDYDPSDANPGMTLQTMRQMSGAVSTNCYNPVRLVVNPSVTLDRTHRLYCDNFPGNDALRNMGRFYIGAVSDKVGETVSPLLGVLWVEYDVELINPEVTTKLLDSATRVVPSEFDPAAGNAANPFSTRLTNAVVQAMQSPIARQGLNILLKAAQGVMHGSLATEQALVCDKVEEQMLDVAPSFRLHSQANFEPTADPAVSTRVLTAFTAEEEMACYVLAPGDHRDYLLFAWCQGTWTPDGAEDYPQFGLEASDNVELTEWLPSTHGAGESHAFPVAHTAYANTVVMSGLFIHINDTGPAYFRLYIAACHGGNVLGMTGTWVGSPNLQRLFIIPTGIGCAGASQWHPKLEL